MLDGSSKSKHRLTKVSIGVIMLEISPNIKVTFTEC